MSHLSPEDIEAVAQGGAHAHLSDCAACRASVQQAKGRRKLLAGMTPYTLSDMAFRRVEAKLVEAVDEGLPTPMWRPWWVLPALGVAAALVLVLTPRSASETPTLPPVPQVAVAKVPFSSLTVVAASGDARVRQGAGEWTALRAGAQVGADTAVSGAEVVLAPAAGPRWAFGVSGTATFGGAAAVMVGAGRVSVEVRDAVSAQVGGLLLTSSDAAFSMTRAAAEVLLEVSRGEVEVVDSATGTRRRVKAPSTLRFADGSAVDDARVETAAPAAVALRVPPAPWATLELAGLPDGTALSLDGLALGVTPASFVMTAGRRELLVQKPGLPAYVAWVDLVGGGISAVPPAPERTPAAVEPDEATLRRFSAELARQRPRLAVCYEKWLKATPGASASVVMTLSVSAAGRVTRARLSGDALPQASSSCLVRTAKTLVLPSLGTAQDIEVPLNLTPRGR